MLQATIQEDTCNDNCITSRQCAAAIFLNNEHKICVNICIKCGLKNASVIENYLPDIIQFKKRESVIQATNKIKKMCIEEFVNKDEYEEQLLIIENNRTQSCQECRDKMRQHNNLLYDPLRQNYKKLRTPCVKCGYDDLNCIELNHIDPKGIQNINLKKEADVSNYKYWYHTYKTDAVEHQTLEAQKTESLCVCCHALEDTNCANQGQILDNMPTNTQVQKKAKREREYKVEKHNYNVKRKLEKVQCEDPNCTTGIDENGNRCALKVTETNTRMFQWAHINELEKESKVSDLIHNRQSPKTAIPYMDKEIERCRLKCANCHKIETDSRREGIQFSSIDL